MIVGVNAATWGIAGFGNPRRERAGWNFPEFIWVAAGPALLVLLNLLSWADALAAAAKVPTYTKIIIKSEDTTEGPKAKVQNWPLSNRRVFG